MRKASARLVDVGFVAYEKKGHPLTNLTQNEIESFDNGKNRPIQLFYQAAPATPSSTLSPAALSAGPKSKSLRVIVYDENSGRLGSVTLPASALQP